MKIRYYVGTEHASGKDVSSDKAVLSGPRVRVSGGGHEMGGQGWVHRRPHGNRAVSEGTDSVPRHIDWTNLCGTAFY